MGTRRSADLAPPAATAAFPATGLSGMSLALRRRSAIAAGPLATDAPYAERADRKDGKLDSILLSTWGGVSPYLRSALSRGRFERLAHRVEGLEPQLANLPDRRLCELAGELRARLPTAGFQSHGIALSFALAREATRRTIGMRHFHTQLLGGAALMSGALAEMETGEGKTLTALLPAGTAGARRDGE
jgi:preprotein translocase subunit SecA